MYRNDKVIRRYSEPFKLKILDEITTGRLNKNQLGKLYGIAPTTINEWIRKYNRKDLMNTRIKVETKDEPDNRLLELADISKADFIITGNTNDFTMEIYNKTRIVTP
ncbi:MAG TPA: hypothetical protein VGA80_03645 [Flavobacteriaceae bacterium]|jgi:predicted nucleic acid-binding protein